ncbi:MAG TPA: hypothetical protein VN040_09290, partial [Pseudosphingobacterium sp.]|nr:hypothetical protein [Pseudosphingobacterium sp.]
NKNNLIINQSVDGLFTERYETYKIHLIGFPFSINKVAADDHSVAITVENDIPTVVVNKDFRNILIN